MHGSGADSFDLVVFHCDADSTAIGSAAPARARFGDAALAAGGEKGNRGAPSFSPRPAAAGRGWCEAPGEGHSDCRLPTAYLPTAYLPNATA